MRTGVANLTLDTGRCPVWLFRRMTRLCRIITSAIVEDFGPEEFLQRMSDPVWFQSLGTIIGFDWNSSGLTTITLGALKESLKGLEKKLGVFVCGGKRVSRRTPEEITFWGRMLGIDGATIEQLILSSKAAAKVDSALVQDGFMLYHHNFLFTQKGSWAVIQQGMSAELSRARRYHWYGPTIKSFIEEPHTGIASQVFLPTVLNLTAKESMQNRQTSIDLIHSPKTLYGDIQIISSKSNSQLPFKILTLEDREFRHHPVEQIDFSSTRLAKTLYQLVAKSPTSYEQLLMTPGVGGKTIRALSLIAEVIYGAKPSYEDPARYSFGFGGKDGTPYPVDRTVYDRTLHIVEHALGNAKIEEKERYFALKRAEKFLTQGHTHYS